MTMVYVAMETGCYGIVISSLSFIGPEFTAFPDNLYLQSRDLL